jgi:hypothetical protein
MANLCKPEFLPKTMNKAFKQKRLVPKRDVKEGKGGGVLILKERNKRGKESG